MCNKVVDNYPNALEFVPECYKTQKMCDKAVNTYPSTMNFFLNSLWLKRCVIKQLIYVFCFWFYSKLVYNQEVCDRVVSEDLFLIVYYPDKYKSQIMCDEAVDDSPAALNLIPDWFVTSKMIKKHFTP